MFGVYGVPGYCTFCEAEATQVVPSVLGIDDEPLRFCDSCYPAFTLGQANPTAEAIDADQEEVDLTCPICKATSQQPIDEYSKATTVYCVECSGKGEEMLNRRELERWQREYAMRGDDAE